MATLPKSSQAKKSTKSTNQDALEQHDNKGKGSTE
jgi:hypothetical protein